jgi:hypothetical protein
MKRGDQKAKKLWILLEKSAPELQVLAFNRQQEVY